MTWTVEKTLLEPGCVLAIQCNCGNRCNIKIDPEWEINICGVWEFTCPSCHRVHRIPAAMSQGVDLEKDGIDEIVRKLWDKISALETRIGEMKARSLIEQGHIDSELNRIWKELGYD